MSKPACEARYPASRSPPGIALIAAMLCCAVASASAATQTPKLALAPAVGVQFHCTWNQSEAKRRAIATKLAAAGVHDNRPGLASWQRGVSAAEQAAYLTRAFSLVGVRYPYVAKAFWYKDAARPGEDDVQSGYGLLKTDLSPRPAYTALKALRLG